MGISWIAVIAGVGLVAGVASYLSAYTQISRSYAQPEARRRALAAVPGPMAFYAVLGTVVTLAAPLMLQR
jgi:hypothetical protein